MKKPIYQRRPQHEGSAANMAEDRRGAGLLNISLPQYEMTQRDKVEDAKGQARLDKSRPKLARHPWPSSFGNSQPNQTGTRTKR